MRVRALIAFLLLGACGADEFTMTLVLRPTSDPERVQVHASGKAIELGSDPDNGLPAFLVTRTFDDCGEKTPAAIEVSWQIDDGATVTDRWERYCDCPAMRVRDVGEPTEHVELSYSTYERAVLFLEADHLRPDHGICRRDSGGDSAWIVD